MRYLLSAVILLVASAAVAEVFRLEPSGTISATCTAGGGASASIPGGYYEIHVSGETANVCYAATCASGGMERVRGNHGVSLVREGSLSCRSAGGSAVVQLVPAVFVR